MRREELQVTADEEAIADAIEDPTLFAEVFLDHQLWAKQQEILHSVFNNPRTAVKACHSSGKTFLAADAVLAWLAKYQDGVVITTAPTDMQVRTLLWGEIANTCTKSRYPFPAPNQTKLVMGPKRFALGFSTSVTNQNQGVKFQGFHSGHILIILDEAPGVHPGIWGAIEGIRAGGKVSTLAIGNPTINSGPFFDCFSKNLEGVSAFTISAFDTPNLKGLTIADLLRWEQEAPENLTHEANPYGFLTTRQWVLDRFKEWGEDHPLYQSRVLGLFPEQSEWSLLSLAWLELAKLREGLGEGDVNVGLDVAGPGEDETTLVIRRGSRIILNKSWTKEDPRGEVVAELNPYKGKIKALNVDCIGVGWGIYLHLKDIFGGCVVPVNVGEASLDPEKYLNLKAELYWGLRMRLQAGDFSGLEDDKAIAQLAGLRYETNPRGQILIEPKKLAVKRGVKSPDRAEAIMLAYARPMKPGGGLMDWLKNQQEQANT